MQTNAERQAKYRAANLIEVRERERLHKLKSKYGVTQEMWQDQFNKQGGLCLGCLKVFTKKRDSIPCVDHDHETGEFRGLLCHGCNRSIGLLKENVDTLRRLADYLAGNRGPVT